MPLDPNLELDRPVGQFVQPQALTLRDTWTVDEAIAHLRANPADFQVLYLYVLDDNRRLVGVISARKMLLTRGEVRLAEIMDRGVVRLEAHETLFDACELFAMHRLLAIPVVDAAGLFLGTMDVSVYTQEVFDLAERQAADEVFQVIGVHVEQARNATAWRSYKLRMPWLLANIGGGLACAVLAGFFDTVLKSVLLIALFIPIMLALSESVSIQSMTLAIQSAAGGRLRRPAWREFVSAVLLAATSGLIIGLVALIWRYPPRVPAIIAGAIAINMTLSALIGNLVPKAITRMRLNPNIASGPIVLATADMVSITIYLGLASLALVGGQAR